MICIEELISLNKRLELLYNNTDNPEEKLATNIVMENVANLIRQINEVVSSPQFKEMAKKE
jgi:UDP-N-acetylglucosamine 2-epimerase